MGDKEDRSMSADGSRAEGGAGESGVASAAGAPGAESGAKPSDNAQVRDGSFSPGVTGAGGGGQDSGEPGPPSADSSWGDSEGALGGDSDSGVAGSASIAVAGTCEPPPSFIMRAFASAPSISWPGPGDLMGGRFELRREIGHGQFGRVHEAWDRTLQAPAAVKVVQPGDAADFLKEARLLASVRAPNVVSVLDAGTWQPGVAWLATELLDGASLQDVIAERASEKRPFQPSEAVEIVLDVLAGLSRVHAVGLVHRDLKPANVYILPSSSAKVLDFGLAASVVRQGAGGASGVAGTPSYMAPEQWRGAPPDPRIDVWAAGAVLYELLTGEPPFHEVTAQSGVDGLRSAVLAPGPVPSVAARRKGLPGALVQVLDRALCKDPRERFDGAASFRGALVKVLPQLILGSSRSPFRFLFAFGVKDAYWFCGRRTLIDELVRTLDGAPFVALVGPSGAGKTSVVQAGLFPALNKSNPALVLDAFRPGKAADRQRLAALQAPPEGAGLLFVDQLEELFAPGVPDDERTAVLTAIVRLAAAPGQWKIAVAMRHDRIDTIGSHGGFQALFEGHLKLVRKPTHTELAETVRVPAERGGRVVEAGLAERMVTRLDRETAPLPLLQLAASVLWERAEQEGVETITATHLEALGDLEGIVGARADKALAELGSVQARDVAREILLALVREGRRRRVPREELLSECPGAVRAKAEWVLDRLVRERLVTASKETIGSQEEYTVELAHDLLIDKWSTLDRWLRDNAKHLAIRDRATRAAELWQADGRAQDRLWTRADLKDGMAWQAEWRGHVHPLVRDFLAASMARDRRGARIVAALATLVSAGLVTATVVSIGQWRAAVLARDTAIASERLVQKERNAANHLLNALVDGLDVKLDSTGRADIIQSTLANVTEYYGERPSRLGVDDSSYQYLRLARASCSTGEALGRMGKLKEAHESYDEATRLHRTILKAHPSDAGYMLALADCLASQGALSLTLGELDEAATLYKESIDLHRSAVAASPPRGKYDHWDTTLVYHVKRVVWRLAWGDADSAMRSIRMARMAWYKLAAGEYWSSYRQVDLAEMLDRLAAVCLGSGAVDKSVELLEESHDIRHALAAKYPANPRWRDDASASYTKMGVALLMSRGGEGPIEHIAVGLAQIAETASSERVMPYYLKAVDDLLSPYVGASSTQSGERVLRDLAMAADRLSAMSPSAGQGLRFVATRLAIDALHAPALAWGLAEPIRTADSDSRFVVCKTAEAALAAARPYAEVRRKLDACAGLSAEEPETMVAAQALCLVAAVEAGKTADANAAASALRAALAAPGGGPIRWVFGGSRAALESRRGPHAPSLIRLLTALEEPSPDERARGVEAALAALGLATGG